MGGQGSGGGGTEGGWHTQVLAGLACRTFSHILQALHGLLQKTLSVTCAETQGIGQRSVLIISLLKCPATNAGLQAIA